MAGKERPSTAKGRPPIPIIEPGLEEHAVIERGDISIDLREVQKMIDTRKNDALAWSRLMAAINAGMQNANIAKRTTARNHNTLARTMRPLYEKDANGGNELTQIEQAKFYANNPFEGLADVIINHFGLDTNAPLLAQVLRDTEERFFEKSSELDDARLLPTFSGNDDFGLLDIVDKTSAAELWKKLVYERVIPRAREADPELYNASLSDAQVWRTLVNKVYDRKRMDSAETGDDDLNSQQIMLQEMLPLEGSSQAICELLSISQSDLAKALMYAEIVANHGFTRNRESVVHSVENHFDRARYEAERLQRPPTTAHSFTVLSRNSVIGLDGKEGDSPHAAAQAAARDVDTSDDPYAAFRRIRHRAHSGGWGNRVTNASDGNDLPSAAPQRP